MESLKTEPAKPPVAAPAIAPNPDRGPVSINDLDGFNPADAESVAKVKRLIARCGPLVKDGTYYHIKEGAIEVIPARFLPKYGLASPVEV
jgi:hypothetical protein